MKDQITSDSNQKALIPSNVKYKPSELRALPTEQLIKNILEIKQEMLGKRIAKNKIGMRFFKKSVARIKTLINERRYL